MDICSKNLVSFRHKVGISPTLPSPGNQDSGSSRRLAGGVREFCKSEGLSAPHFCEIFPPPRPQPEFSELFGSGEGRG